MTIDDFALLLEVIADALERDDDPALRELNLSKNRIGAVGAAALGATGSVGALGASVAAARWPMAMPRRQALKVARRPRFR